MSAFRRPLSKEALGCIGKKKLLSSFVKMSAINQVTMVFDWFSSVAEAFSQLISSWSDL